MPLEVLRTRDAAAYCGLKKPTLERFRLRGEGPPFLKLGSRAIAYLRDDLDKWLLSRRRTSTADRGAAA